MSTAIPDLAFSLRLWCITVWRRKPLSGGALFSSAAYSAHPERFVRKPPQPLPAPKEVWINKPQPTPENKTQ